VFDAALPFGGYKQFGLGAAKWAQGRACRNYLEMKAITSRHPIGRADRFLIREKGSRIGSLFYFPHP